MKRTFLSRRNALLRGHGSRAGVVVLAVALVLVLARILAPGLLLSATAPLYRAASAIGASVSNISNGFKNSAALAQERDTLLSENAALAQENGVLSAEVADLKQLGPVPAAGITAGVLARPPETPYDTLIVAAGSAQGAAVGDSVRGPGGVPIGRVAAVSASAARVVLYSSPEASTTAWIGAARTPAMLLGEGGGAFQASVPRAASTSVGDIVYLASGGAVPIGKVAQLGGDPSSPSMTLAISSSVNIFSIPYVVLVHAVAAP
jgi:cell shape-determining protein MreC